MSHDNEFSGGANNLVNIDFDMVNEADTELALGKLTSVKVTWDPEDLEYWFGELEQQMELIQIRAQWTKRVILSNNLPRRSRQR